MKLSSFATAYLIPLFLLQSSLSFAQDHQCAAGYHWDDGMSMCMPDAVKTSLMFHVNQFLVGGVTTGLRGDQTISGPGYGMIDFNHRFSDKNSFSASAMIDGEAKWNPKRGTTELLQVGDTNSQGVPFVDHQHPHPTPLMALTFSDLLTLTGGKSITISFSDIGPAAAGPQTFMHRLSATGNSIVPETHDMTDGFHDASTVAGVAYSDGRNTVDGSAFSGRSNISTKYFDIGLHPIDSYSFRYNRKLGKFVTVGASYARVSESSALTPDVTKQDAIATWAKVSAPVGLGTLDLEATWGTVINETEHQTVNGALVEFSYRLKKNNFYGRMEVYQRTADELNITLLNSSGQPQWAKTVTVGYERSLFKKGMLHFYGGGYFTENWTPNDFASAYGSKNPMGGGLQIRATLAAGTKGSIAPDEADLEPTYSSIYKFIILPKCATCHTTTIGDGDGLVKVNMDTYDTLVNPADPKHRVIDTTNAKESRLFKAITRHLDENGVKQPPIMPKAMDGATIKPDPLSAIEAQTILDWIKAGAPNN